MNGVPAQRPEVVHVLFGGRHRSGRDTVVATLARGQCTAHVYAVGATVVLQYLYSAGMRLSAAPGHGLLAWLRLLRMLYRDGPPSTGPARHTAVVHGHGLRALLLIATLRTVSAAWRAVPAVYSNHGFVETAVVRRLLLWLEPLLYRAVDHVVVCNQAQAATLARMTRRPVHVVANAVTTPLTDEEPTRDAARGRWGLAGARPVIAIVGRLAAEKRHDVCLAATALILRHHPHTVLLIAGDGPRRTWVRGVAGRYGLLGHVRFLGHVDNVGSVYRAVDLLLHTSDTEGMPLAVMEAMAAGVPVVATAVGGVPTLIADGRHGLLVPRRRPDLLADAALRLLADDRLRQEIVRAARHIPDEFSLQRMRDHLDAIYASASPAGVPNDSLRP